MKSYFTSRPSLSLLIFSAVAFGASGTLLAQSQEYINDQGSQPGSSNEVNSYLPSSSRPIVGNEEDSFDAPIPQGRANTVRASNDSGKKNQSLGTRDGETSPGVDLSGTEYELGSASSLNTAGSSAGADKNLPEFHSVAKGDTLWAVSSQYFGNPWEWPRVWSNNPQVENPHWIYPGDQLRIGDDAESASDFYETNDDNTAGSGGFIGRKRLVPAGTIFLRDQGFIGDPKKDKWGELVGALEDMMFLSTGNSVYLLMNEGVELRLGQRLNLFADVRNVSKVRGARKPPGSLVKVFGTVRVDDWNQETRIARAKIIEALDVIERGVHVGPVGRRFDVVPPKKASKQVLARIITSISPNIFFGEYQLVFIDKGSDDGLSAGNRLRVFRRGDTWRRGLKSTSRHASQQLNLDSYEPPELDRSTPIRGDDTKFPDEIIGEVQILRTQKYSSVALVTASKVEFSRGDRMIATPDY